MQRVINFSGGRTSAYMTIMCYRPGDIVLFCDTGREHPATYDFIKKFEMYEHIPVHKITYKIGKLTGFEAMFKHQKYRKVPNRMKRICTFELKIFTAKRWLRKKGIQRFINLIGFRADEQSRILSHKEKYKKVTTSFPLNEMGVTKEIVNDFWSKKPYNLTLPNSDTPLPKILGNCDLCFLKGKAVIIAIMRDHPELADKWIQDEERAAKTFGHTYFPGTTYKELLEASKKVKRQDLSKLEPAFNCACTT